MTAMTKNFLANLPTRLIAATLFSLMLSQAALAESSQGVFKMMAIKDMAQGRLVTRGAYDIAIARLEAASKNSPEFEVLNNLCVAHTKSNALEKAIESCDDAVAAAPVKESKRRISSDTEYRARLNRAIALSNRGVLRAVTDDIDGAREDFHGALALHRKFDETHGNLAYLETYRSRERATAQYIR